MVKKLEGIGFHPQQFRFNVTKPDLTKFDKLLGLLSTESTTFEEQLVEATSALTLNDQTSKSLPAPTSAEQGNAATLPGTTTAASNLPADTPAAQDVLTRPLQGQEQMSTTTSDGPMTESTIKMENEWELV